MITTAQVTLDAGQPGTVKAQGVLAPILAIVSDKTGGSGLFVQQSRERLHPVAIDDDPGLLTDYPYRSDSATLQTKVSAAARSAPFTLRPEGRGIPEHIE